jgi:endonuclease YncB( thermonuclease family)
VAAPYYLAIRGRLVVVGKEPDGDSVRFIAEHPEHYRQLKNAHRIDPSADGSVQLRFEGVDAPELHYGSAAQPLGREARDQLLAWIGFSDLDYAPPGETRVTSATPESVPAFILSQAAEVNGRPVSYLLLEEQAAPAQDGAWTLVDRPMLDRTLNARLLQEGVAYPTVYSSTPVGHRAHLRTLATEAREKAAGVWAIDASAGFVLDDQASIGPEGQLILPKLFRRATDYLRARDGGFQGNLADWLLQVSASPSRNENDQVVVCGGIEVHLSDLLLQANRTVRFQADLLDVVFVEK